MVVKHILCNPSWDKLIKSAGSEGSLHQTAHWAEVRQHLDKATPIFLQVLHDSCVVASFLIFHCIPFNRNTRKKVSPFKPFVEGKFNGWIEWNGGPVIHNLKFASKSVDALLSWIDEYSKKQRNSYIKGGSFARSSVLKNDLVIRDIFISHNYNITNWGNFTLDLILPEENLWKQLRKNRRRDINLAERKGAKFIEIKTWDDFYQKFYLPYLKTEQFHGRSTNSKDVWKYLWDKDRDKYYNYYVVVDKNGQTLSTMAIFTFNGISSEMAVCVTPLALENRITAQDLIQWKTIIQSQKKGSNIFDFAGVSPNPQNSKERGIRQFKEKWGGNYEEYYIYEKRIPSLATTTFRILKYISSYLNQFQKLT